MKNKEIKFETLKKNYKKHFIIGVVAICIIGSALTFKLTHSKYRVTQSIDLGSGVINYKVPDFKIMAMYQQKDGNTCTDDYCYNEITDRMPSTGYVINSSKSYCTLDNINHDNEVVLKTENGEHLFKNLKKSDKCYLYFDKIKITNTESLIANSHINIGSPDFSQTATTDEGIFLTSDGMYGGTTYYWRGATTTNHVIFANKCWRIVRINGDKTMRLIYNGGVLSNNTCFGNGENADSIAVTKQKYNSSDKQSNYVGWTYSGTSQRTLSGTDSNAKAQTQTWYNNNIGNNTTYNSKVADGKFCNNRNAASGYTWSINGSDFYYEEYTNIQNGTPKTTCPSGDEYTLKVGAITASEVIFAGGTNSENKSYYLYNGQGYWTMSPGRWRYSSAGMFVMIPYGNLLEGVSTTGNSYGVRPVINLKADITFSSGNGTQNSPYVVSGN